MITTSIVFDHKIASSRSGGVGNIEIRVTTDRRSKYISTGVRVEKKQFAGGAVVGRHDAGELNRRVCIIYDRVIKLVNDCIEKGCEPDVDELRRAAWAVNEAENANTLLDWIETQESLMRVSEGTKAHYRTLRIRLAEFGMTRWSDVNAENIVRFDSWLHDQRKKQSDARKKAGEELKPLRSSSIYNYHKQLKAMLNRAVVFGQISRNPYERLKGQIVKGDSIRTEYLTDEEMQRIVNLHPTPGTLMCVVRDLFVVQMYTGMAFGDMMAFDINNYIKRDGKWVAVGERIKTGVPYVSQLLPPVVEVLERYHFVLPTLTLNKYNGALKTMGDLLGMRVSLHSHLARHTFATWMLRNGVKIENLSKMLGHTNITQTQRYAKVLAESVHEEFDMIAAKMKEA